MNQSNGADLKVYLSGQKLYGDDFSGPQIEQWFREESEGYADLGSKEFDRYSYPYHALNHHHGFRYLSRVDRFEHVLGFGAAWGHEFEPLIDRIDRLTIIEPSEKLRSQKIGNLHPTYVTPTMEGKMEFPDHTFDLITCFGTLHHIPNVSHVLEEILRVLKPGGFLLLREPIISMGDWTQARTGLTSNERGIPLSHFDRFFAHQQVQIISRSHCFTMAYQMNKLFKPFLKKSLFSYAFYVRIDRVISFLLQKNTRYHATRKIRRIAPSDIFFVVKKI
jgi:SAM-dependent methyltransferase